MSGVSLLLTLQIRKNGLRIWKHFTYVKAGVIKQGLAEWYKKSPWLHPGTLHHFDFANK